MPFRTPLPHQIEALHELAELTMRATGAVELEICSRSGAMSRTLLHLGGAHREEPVHRREATTPLPIGSELVVMGAFVSRPDIEVQRALLQAASSAAAVLGTSVMIEPGREANSPFALFDTAPMPIWIFDVDTLQFLDVNSYAVSRYGYSREEFLRMSILDIRPEEEREAIEREARIARRGFTVWKYVRHQWKSGEVRDVGLVGYDIEYRGRAARLVMVDDVTEQLRAERTKDLLLAAVENLEELVILFQQPRRGRRIPRITFVNAAFERLFGWERGALLTGVGIRDIISGLNEAVSQSLVEIMSKRQATMAEFDVHNRDGQVLRMEFTIVPVRTDDGGEVTHWAAIARDITQRAALAERSMQAQRLEAMGMFAGGIAHDFNNLVVAISGFTQLALKHLPADSRAADDIRHVQAAAGRAAALAQQLLAFSRQQELSPQRLDVCALVASLQPMLQRMLDVNIRLTVSCDGVVEVVADRTQIEQVLLNLVVNARDAQPEGGFIAVAVDVVTAQDVRDSVPDLPRSPSGVWVRLSVSDGGPGIPDEVRQRVFEPFYTTKRSGTGLGLSTVHGIVQQSGGQVSLHSPRGGGTCAEVLLPSPMDAHDQNNRAREREHEQNDAQKHTAPFRGTMLIFSDDARIRRVYRESLRTLGVRPLVASSMAEAAKCLAREDGVDVAVVDIRGAAKESRTVAELRAARPQLRLIVVTDPDNIESTPAYNGNAADSPAAASDGNVVALTRPATAEDLQAAATRNR